MNSSPKQKIGYLLEARACDYLQKNGLRLIKKNYRCYAGEIDLIMQDREDIVFVEVRGRSNVFYGSALESIDDKKIARINKAASHFLQAKCWYYTKTSRFDVVVFEPAGDELQLNWIKNAFTVED